MSTVGSSNPSNREVIWEPLYNGNTGSSLHPATVWTTLVGSSDIELFTGYDGPNHSLVTISNSSSTGPESRSWSGQHVPATFNQYHPLQPPIVLIQFRQKMLILVPQPIMSGQVITRQTYGRGYK